VNDLLKEASLAAAFWPDRLPTQLESVRQKLLRADEHHAELAAEVQAFVEGPPYLITESFDGDVHVMVAEVVQHPPMRLSVILGDLLYNLRSALDHLAWQFALATTERPDWRTAFPIYDSPREFKDRARIQDVPPEVALLMEAMQPYHDRAQGVLPWLGQELVPVRNMGNRDKHQSLHIVTALVNPKYVETNTPQGQPSGVEFSAAVNRQRATIRMPLGSKGHFEATATILDDELPWGSGVDGIAHHLVNSTRNAIAAFRPVFRLLPPP
jgi:hypothetical protein